METKKAIEVLEDMESNYRNSAHLIPEYAQHADAIAHVLNELQGFGGGKMDDKQKREEMIGRARFAIRGSSLRQIYRSLTKDAEDALAELMADFAISLINDGWREIKSEDDLPKVRGYYFWRCNPDQPHKPYPYEAQPFNPEHDARDSFAVMYWTGNYTHWMPIPPIKGEKVGEEK